MRRALKFLAVLAGVISLSLVALPSQAIQIRPHAPATLDYHGQDLRSHYFGADDLTGADFSGANLYQATFDGTNLTNANFTGANVVGAYFTNTNVQGANLSFASQNSAVGRGMTGTPSVIPGGKIAKGYLVMSFTDINHADLSGADLSGINIGGPMSNTWDNITGVNFAGANLSNSQFTFTQFAVCDFHGANLDNSGFTMSSFYSSNLTDTSLQGGSFIGIGNFNNSNLTRTNLLRTNLDQIIFNTDLVEGTQFATATLAKTQSSGLTGTPASLPTSWSITNGAFVPPFALTTPPTPTISGAGLLGSVLTAAWNTHYNVIYSWMRDGSEIAGATSATYTVTKADLGHAITVLVFGDAPGYPQVNAVSNPLQIVYAMAGVQKPKISGTAKVGSTLSVVVKPWTSGANLTYSWQVGGTDIVGAYSGKLKLTKAYKGKAITVTVTQGKLNYQTTAQTSAPVKVK